jgi:hypothetical protein
MKKECPKCKNEFSTRGNNYEKHVGACNGIYLPFVKSKCCKHCSLDFENLSTSERANHSRWCIVNPKREQYNKNTSHMRGGITEESIKKRTEGIKLAHINGKYKESSKKSIETRKANGTLCHSEASKQKLREKALASPHRRLRKGIINYKGILLESSWELALAKRLDELEIKWVRPDPIPWIDDEGVTHNYFPDFYLSDYNLFLDPKNPQAKKVQEKKLKCLLNQYDNIIIIDTLSECKNFSVPYGGKDLTNNRK